jgi:acyl-coenzyme A synthetase/AMP-(fatty) acid ligase
VIDDDGREVEEDVVGEIAIRSRYLAPGYWNRGDLTNAAFLPGPAGDGERIYRTGDLGRMRAGQCLEYLGRKDRGYKIRGNRVEPAEVERALVSLDVVREAAVVTREVAPGVLASSRTWSRLGRQACRCRSSGEAWRRRCRST